MALCCLRPGYVKPFTLLLIILCTLAQPFLSQHTELIDRNDCELTSRTNWHLRKTVAVPIEKNNALLVSLMNGEVKALNIDTGALLWRVRTGNQLLSSSISSLEVIYNGIPTRLIPSLDGSLFRFHDDIFEPLPFSAETLLSSSFKLPGDSSVVGSKELRTVGVNPTCGYVYYKCDKEGCDRVEQDNLHEKDVLVLRHLTHTVRAASLRNGEEKWNFSVGYHELSFAEADVPLYTAGAENAREDVRVKFDVPDGVVLRLNNKKEKVWEYQFGVPVARAWLLTNGHLNDLDLLHPKYMMTNERISGVDGESADDKQPAPSLYIGVFEKQVYLQVSARLRKNASAIASLYQHGSKSFTAVPRVKWAPYITSTPSRTPWLNYGKSDPSISEPTKSTPGDGNAVSVFNPTMDYPYDQGFYLIAQEENTPQVDKEDHQFNSTYFDEFDNIMVVQIVSLTYYWREVLAISIIFAVILNGILYITRAHRRKLQSKLKYLGGAGDTNEVSDVSDVSEDDKKAKKRNKTKTVKPAEAPVPPQYQSRYKSDFTHIQCLGKGGFGVVFHARNALDERDYAIKRISLPNSDEAKEKVMREVKALAMLDHANIVRYFQSWFETPPTGWQEDQDKIWETSERLLPTPMNSGCPLNTPDVTASFTKGPAAKSKGNDFFIPKLRLDDSNMSNGSFGFPVNHPVEDSLDIVFTSHSGETSVSANQPFHKYAVAPAELDHDNPDSDSEWDQLEDSGYHKNRLTLLEATDSSADDTLDNELSQPLVNSPTPSQLSRKPEDTQSKLFLYIQMQLCKKETLREYLNANTLHRDRNEILLIFRQICDAVEYIHSQGLIHRDLKPTNIFFSAENTIKVGDFGLVTALSSFPDEEEENKAMMDRTLPQQSNLTNNVGTQLYMSPEQVARRQYNNKVDIYALGLLFFELKYPFSTVMERVYTLQGIKRHKYPERFVRELSREYKFIKWMLTRNPTRRPTISEVLHSEVMSGSDDLLQANRRNRTISRSSSGNEV